jgi:hypothetical protein
MQTPNPRLQDTQAVTRNGVKKKRDQIRVSPDTQSLTSDFR